MKIEIKHRVTNQILFTHESENNTTQRTVRAAIAARVELVGANFVGADLKSIDFSGINCAGADFDRTNVAGSNFAGTNLIGTSFIGANLDSTNFAGANLYGANFYKANLFGTDFSGANIVKTNFVEANLDGELLTKTPLSLVNLRWNVLITEQYMRIGCERHAHKEWAAMDDASINRMEIGALKFWRTWKLALLELCKQHCDAQHKR
jgi:uncharacterized protein YjbI with pentapeptide repeats